ncbi:acetyl-CoA acetyltransferase [Mycolicibacterium neoaurum]|uniref:thiolase C-terminal domain-containing protein n=1 Tax=Mycolicibacterium TaxID=1866885 RepID=UPI00248C683A|nr:acetyl-CoA acetyltransferase [Mycolicibacterium neoaurum]WBP96608.1 acetyl-CoA acetyltransferase [Mycolicibacterium neoaurum]WBS10294.1 acetyl-CoA acetyltransferase [Mycolicibacterium neoaurum]
MDNPFRDAAAIVGVGRTDYSKRSGVSTLTLAVQAIGAALADAGLTARDVDGVACHRIADSADPALVAQVLGIADVRFIRDVFGGGSSCITPLAAAAGAVASGQARCVVVWRALNARSGPRMSDAGAMTGLSSDAQYWLPYQHVSAPAQFAMFTRAYMHRYGLTEEVLGMVALNQRDNAVRNPAAMMRQPLSMDDYLGSRWIYEPLRLFDCCIESDAAVAMVVTSPARGRDTRRLPVTICATASGGGSQLASNHRSDITVSGAARMAPRLYEAAGMGPEDIDVAEFYDAFSSLVPLQLEAYGFCEPGAAASMIAAGETRIGGRLPVNTHGGHLSEAYVHGLNHVVEAVRQLRHECGDRQVAGAEVALSTAQPGINSGITGAVILKRGG